MLAKLLSWPLYTRWELNSLERGCWLPLTTTQNLAAQEWPVMTHCWRGWAQEGSCFPVKSRRTGLADRMWYRPARGRIPSGPHSWPCLRKHLPWGRLPSTGLCEPTGGKVDRSRGFGVPEKPGRFHIWVVFYGICFSLSDLPHSAFCMMVSRSIHVSANGSTSFLFMAE